jgi:hypothetical protein
MEEFWALEKSLENTSRSSKKFVGPFWDLYSNQDPG